MELFDIKDKAEEIFKKIKANKNLKADFEKDPVKTIEGIIGVDLPDAIILKLIDAVKDKIKPENISGIASKIGEILDKDKK